MTIPLALYEVDAGPLVRKSRLLDLKSVIITASKYSVWFYIMKKYDQYKQHVLARINASDVGKEPYYHLYIEDIFPDLLHEMIRKRIFYNKYHGSLQTRAQDNRQFVNRRLSLMDNTDLETLYVRRLFSDPEIKQALMSKFYLDPNPNFLDQIEIHEKEFEYMFTETGRFQNIHVDIPAKYLSMVFYFPEEELTEDDQAKNATIFYDKELTPHYKAKYKTNSVGIFAPHYYSYHGFSTTIGRESMVVFYINKVQRERWISEKNDSIPPIELLKNNIQQKLEAFPLIEYGNDKERILFERKQCMINAPQGRVMLDKIKTK